VDGGFHRAQATAAIANASEAIHTAQPRDRHALLAVTVGFHVWGGWYLKTTPSAAVPEAPPQTLQDLCSRLERLLSELKFKQTRIDTLNFEVAWLKRWRLWLLQREPGEHHAGGAVRFPPHRHRT
jgi:hypothetical protein